MSSGVSMARRSSRPGKSSKISATDLHPFDPRIDGDPVPEGYLGNPGGECGGMRNPHVGPLAARSGRNVGHQTITDTVVIELEVSLICRIAPPRT